VELSLHAASASTGALVLLGLPSARSAPSPASIVLETTLLIGTGSGASNCAQILVDEEAGAREATGWLLDLGHPSVALFCPPASGASRLVDGWAGELGSRGIRQDPRLLRSCAAGVEAGASAAKALLAGFPDCRAFLCGSDRIAAGVARSLREAGILPGKEASIIGYGNSPLAEALALGSIDPRMEDAADLALASAIDGMRQGRLAVEIQRLTPRLVLGASCANRVSPR
jgi:DNA-binding LacI/PurR family transcriptional regulator